MTSLFDDTPSFSDDEIPQFDVVSDISDHHFAGKRLKTSLSTSISTIASVHKKIMQEWKVLSENLPESIFVRAYETRIDLLRAAIVGAQGTPYHDGLFFFDIAFPSDYPAKPPVVYYHSFGYRINPNIYNNGRVCLSLLNTWNGKKSEKWDSKNSTVLQLLLSIQALVLNEKPFFNEPALPPWLGRAFWEKKSITYNERMFILSCKTMLLVLRRPLKNFEPLINQHFKDRAEFILNACDSYRKGLPKDGFVKGEVSAKFQGEMDRLYGVLVLAFSKTGAHVEPLLQQVREEKEMKAKEKTATDTATATYVGKIISVHWIAFELTKRV
ncbi:hypothetical protein BVRB_3g054350 [Beta vulgaris subsp. vulgaris]|nr:hypothetical protein BVRB_3g054350 [Beta vulgaris subsp. vulgaris]